MDFLNYWDTRIDANERFFNNYPHIANFAFIECQALWDRMSADYAALLARHNELVEAVKKEHLAFGALDDAGFQLGEVGMPIWTDHAAARAEADRLLQEPPC